jgi:hypothetical protein
MARDLKKVVALEKYLRTNASSPNYVNSLDSNLYNVHGIHKGPGKLKFFMTTVNSKGDNTSYTIRGRTFLGLTLFVNPASLSVNMAKMINRSQTMTGWVEDHWGEELDTITFQGSSAAFIWAGPLRQPPAGPLKQTPAEIQDMYNDYMDIPDLGINEPIGIGDHTGLTVKRRRETLSYDQFRTIVHLMNANAANFNFQGLVTKRLFIQLGYDYAAYRGYFESVDITEDAETPFKFIYTITFKAEKTIFKFLR